MYSIRHYFEVYTRVCVWRELKSTILFANIIGKKIAPYTEWWGFDNACEELIVRKMYNIFPHVDIYN